MQSSPLPRRTLFRRLGLAGLLGLVSVDEVPAAIAASGPVADPQVADYRRPVIGPELTRNSQESADIVGAIYAARGNVNARWLAGYAPGTLRLESGQLYKKHVDLEPVLDPRTGERWKKTKATGPIRVTLWFEVRRAGWTPQADHHLGPRRPDDFAAFWTHRYIPSAEDRLHAFDEDAYRDRFPLGVTT